MPNAQDVRPLWLHFRPALFGSSMAWTIQSGATWYVVVAIQFGRWNGICTGLPAMLWNGSRENGKESKASARLGGNTQAEIRHIMECQKGRCIYCHRLLTDELIPSKDHLLLLVAV